MDCCAIPDRGTIIDKASSVFLKNSTYNDIQYILKKAGVCFLTGRFVMREVAKPKGTSNTTVDVMVELQNLPHTLIPQPIQLCRDNPLAYKTLPIHPISLGVEKNRHYLGVLFRRRYPKSDTGHGQKGLPVEAIGQHFLKAQKPPTHYDDDGYALYGS